MPIKVVSAPEHRPPAEVGEEVVRTGLIQGVIVRQRVVHPPEDQVLTHISGAGKFYKAGTHQRREET